MRHLLPIAILQLGVSVLHANRFLPPSEMSAGRMPKLLSKKEALVTWNERSTECPLSVYSIFYDNY